MFETLEAIRHIAESEQIPMSRLAIAWAMARPGITCMLVGTRNVNELDGKSARYRIHAVH